MQGTDEKTLGCFRAADAIEERGVQSVSNIFGERNGFGIAKNLDGLAAGVYYDAAVGAVGKVLL
jgi:hypothetical protein